MVRFNTTIALFVVAAAATVSTSSAFVQPGLKRSSFVGTNNNIAFVGKSSSTSLSMNLFDRFQRVVKSNINDVLKNLEDPEKIMTQALDDMQVRFFSESWVDDAFFV